MKKYTVISTLEDPMNIISLLSEKGIKHVKDGEHFIMYPAIVITNKDGDSFPQLQILASLRPNPYISDRVDSNWLSPFRNYKFQVSETITGQFTMGDCPVVGLGNVICADYGAEPEAKMPNGSFASNVGLAQTHISLLIALAKEALFMYTTKLDRGTPRRNHFDYTATTLMDGFIDMVIARLRGANLVPGDSRFMEILDQYSLNVTEVDDIDEFLEQQSAELIKLMPAVES